MGHYTRLCKSNPKDPKAESKEGKGKSETTAGIGKHLLGISLGEAQEFVNQLVRNNQEKLGSAKRRILRHMRYDIEAGKNVST